MKLTRVWAENYKAFQDRVELDLAPLTVIFGRNGSGKSALTRLPLAIGASLGGAENPGLALRTRGITLGNTLSSFVHGGTSQGFSIGFSFVGDDRQFSLEASINKDAKSSNRLPEQWVDRWILQESNRVISSFAWSRDDKAYRSDVSVEVPAPTRFRGLLPVDEDDIPLTAARELRRSPRIVHIGANRGAAGEGFALEQPSMPLDVESDGASTRHILGSLHASSKRAILDSIIESVQQCFEVDLRVEEVAQGPVQGTILSAKPSARSTWRPLAELGTGLVHALPILVQYAIAAAADEVDGTSLVLCEEPEAHVHPSVQARMADVLLASVTGGRCNTILETHSETIILRIRRRIAEGRISPECVAFYWVDDDTDRTRLRKLDIDARGMVEDWPDGWFDTAMHEANAILRAQAY